MKYISKTNGSIKRTWIRYGILEGICKNIVPIVLGIVLAGIESFVFYLLIR